MENIRSINHWHIIKRDWRKLLVVTLAVVLLALVFSLVQPFLYRATESILVLQKSSFSIDAYSASKSEERIANKLAQVVYSSTFLNQLLSSGFDIDKSYFPTDEFKRREKWQKTVETEVPAGLSKLQVSVYHTDPNQALQLSQAIAYVLTTDKQDYIGIEDVDLKVLDTSLVSKYPVRPNIFLNIVLGLILGLILGAIFVIITYNPDQDKLLAIKSKSIIPHLIDNNAMGETKSVEKEMAKADAPEIKELDDVEELAEAEKAEALAENPVEEKVEMPDVSDAIDAEAERLDEQEIREDFISEDKREQPKKEYPRFDDEEKIIGMPEK